IPVGTTTSADFYPISKTLKAKPLHPNQQVAHWNRPPQIRTPTFPCPRRIYTLTISVERASSSIADSPRSTCLICGSCPSVQSFAAGFLPTPPHDDAVAID